MTFRGTFKVKNLNSGDHISSISHDSLLPNVTHSGPAQYLTINGIDYLITKAGSQHKFFAEPSWNGFNNKTVDVEGVFVGEIIIVSSITKVGP